MLCIHIRSYVCDVIVCVQCLFLKQSPLHLLYCHPLIVILCTIHLFVCVDINDSDILWIFFIWQIWQINGNSLYIYKSLTNNF